MPQLWRTPWNERFIVVARDARDPREQPSLFDVPFRIESYGLVRDAALRMAGCRGETYLAAGRNALRVQNLFDDEVTLHWLHRPHSWASFPLSGLEQILPADPERLEVVVTPEYAAMSARYAPPPVGNVVSCPCQVLAVPAETLEAPRPFGAEITPQEVWERLAGPFDASGVATWADRVELYQCRSCRAHWAATQVSDGLSIRYESRHLTPGAFDRLLRVCA